ncbi:MAG: hypothetical protein H0T54_08575 [Geodermatophilaceae bacterium]|nr:hypothetical protein [Geodermatophilaceae bacterium]
MSSLSRRMSIPVSRQGRRARPWFVAYLVTLGLVEALVIGLVGFTHQVSGKVSLDPATRPGIRSAVPRSTWP